MKKGDLVTSVVAIVIGFYLGFLFLKLTDKVLADPNNTDPVINPTNEEVTVFQIGVYKKEATLEKAKQQIESLNIKYIVTSDEEYSYLFGGVALSEFSIKVVKDFLDSKKIIYYEKKFLIENNTYIDMVNSYEKLYPTIEDDDFLEVQELLLNKFEEVIVGEY